MLVLQGKSGGGEPGRRMEGSARGARDKSSQEQSLIWRCWRVYQWLIPVASLPAMLGRAPVGARVGHPLAPARPLQFGRVTRRRESCSAPEPSPFPPSLLLAVRKSTQASGSASQIKPRGGHGGAFLFTFLHLLLVMISPCAFQSWSRGI